MTTKKRKEKQRQLNDARRAFVALGDIVFPDDERRSPGGAYSRQTLDECDGAMCCLAIVIAQLEADFKAVSR